MSYGTYKQRRRAAIRSRLRAAQADGVDINDRAAMHAWTMKRLELLRVSIRRPKEEDKAKPPTLS